MCKSIYQLLKKCNWKLIFKIVIPLMVSYWLVYNGVSNKHIKKTNNLSRELPEKYNNIECIDQRILIKDITILYTRHEIEKHNEKLIGLLENYRNDHIRDVTTIEDRMNTTCTIYFTILVAILVYLFKTGSNAKSNKEKDYKFSIFLIRGFLLVVIFLMYCFNIHQEDSKFKPIFRSDKAWESISKLTNLKSGDNTWYTLRFTYTEKVLRENSVNKIRWKRKFNRFISPNFSQIIYYICPFTFVLILTLEVWPKNLGKRILKTFIRAK